jgi:hypothetical protein
MNEIEKQLFLRLVLSQMSNKHTAKIFGQNTLRFVLSLVLKTNLCVVDRTDLTAEASDSSARVSVRKEKETSVRTFVLWFNKDAWFI